MKTTSNAHASLKSASVTDLPEVSGRRKSGALVPSGNMVELTATMPGMWNLAKELSTEKIVLTM
jgi:hypothetical protein